MARRLGCSWTVIPEEGSLHSLAPNVLRLLPHRALGVDSLLTDCLPTAQSTSAYRAPGEWLYARLPLLLLTGKAPLLKARPWLTKSAVQLCFPGEGPVCAGTHQHSTPKTVHRWTPGCQRGHQQHVQKMMLFYRVNSREKLHREGYRVMDPVAIQFYPQTAAIAFAILCLIVWPAADLSNSVELYRVAVMLNSICC